MTDLTPRELIDTIVRSLKATAERFAPKGGSARPEAPARKTETAETKPVRRARPLE